MRATNPRRRSRAYVLIALLVTALSLVVATAEAWSPSRSQLNERRWKVLGMRKDKCLNVWQPRPLREIPADRLDNAWRWWGEAKERARAKDSKCLSELLWTWYYTSGAKCVREHEGTWTDPNAPYWGGFQADLSFQSTYGGEYLSRLGTADNWPPIAQIHMAYRGHAARGWYPWPTTARICGLL